MFSQLSLPLLALLATNARALIPPTSQSEFTNGQAMSLSRRADWNRTTEQWGSWDKNQGEILRGKYGGGSLSKRSTGTNLLVDQSIDSSYYGSLAVGTPAISYNVILDTGSADFWLADSLCTTAQCSNVLTFDNSASSSFTNISKPFAITYGSGKASGSLGQDTVQMAGFSVPNQVLGLCDVVSDGMLNTPVSGLLGLAFGSLSSAGVTPFWQTLVSSGAWDNPLMAFHLTRFLNDTSASRLEAGGSFTMGFANQSLYTGEIDYVLIPTGQDRYWTIPITAITTQGNAIPLPSGSGSYAAIDTGTTLVGGPAEQIAAIFAQIPNSYAAGGDYEGYYAYPCDTKVTVTMSFGGQTWPISSVDFQLRQVSRSLCIGAFFVIATGSGTPAWIVGDTFLKNVYSIFRYNPLSIGFAQLSNAALAQNGGNAPVPTPTIGSVAAFVSATARSGASEKMRSGMWASLVPALVALAV